MTAIQKLTATIACAATALATLASAAPLDVEVDSSEIDRTQNIMPSSYANMLEHVTPAVVAVHTARIVTTVRGGRGMSPQDELLRRFFGLPAPQYTPESGEPEKRSVPQGIGSGVIVSKDGYIITNHHVVSDQQSGQAADEIQVVLNDGRELSAEIIGSDPLTDVAIIKVDADDLPAIKIADSDNIKVGDVVFAIGNPMGVGLTVTQGIVSATNRAIGIYGERGYESFIQTDASINPGNSGGALIDSQGRLVGVNSAIISRSGGNIGIGFAIPTNLAINISRQLADSGEVRRGFLGVSIGDVTPDLAEAFGLENTDGVLINDVEDDSAADKGGIKRGDIILSVDGKTIKDLNQFRILIGNTVPGTEVAMEIMRDGDTKKLKLEVGSASGRFAVGANELVDGVEVATIDKDAAENYRIPESIKGLIVTEVTVDSPYSRVLVEGMVIMEINDRPVESVSEAREALRSGANKLFVFSRGRTGYIALRVE